MIHDLKGEQITKLMANPKETEGQTDIAKFMKELQKEIITANDEHKKEIDMSRLEQMMQDYNGDDKLISSLDVAARIKSSPPEVKHMTGMNSLDNIIGGFRNKQLVVIAAPTKNGKTSFCIDLTARLRPLNPLWLPFEEPADELVGKFMERGELPPLFYTPERIRGNTLLWVEKKIIEAKVKFGSQVVFIDHLHFIVPFSSERQDLMIGQTMRELKKIAKQWNVVIFLIAHLKKTKLTTAPDLEDLRDSSFIAQEADTVIMLWRKTEREAGEVVISNEVVISVQANRRTGKTGNITLKFDNGRFLEVDKNHKDNERRKTAGDSWASDYDK